MAVRAGREPERLFGDALSGSGGMADPLYRPSVPVDVFPDALSAAPLGRAPWSRPMQSAVPLTPVDARPGAATAVQRPPTGAPVSMPAPRNARPAPVQRRSAPPGPPQPGLRVPGPPRAMPGPPRAVPAGPMPGQPAQQYVPVPTSAQLAAGSGRRPTAGTGYGGPPRTAPGQIRPPAYLPQGQGLAQVRSAITQAGAASARQLAAARSSAKRRSSGAWSFAVLVLVLLVTTGAGQKIISLISQLLQRK